MEDSSSTASFARCTNLAASPRLIESARSLAAARQPRCKGERRGEGGGAGDKEFYKNSQFVMGNGFFKLTRVSDCIPSESKKRRRIVGDSPPSSPCPATAAAAAAINPMRKDQSPMLCGGSDLANFLVLSEFLQHSWDCVSELSGPRNGVVSDPSVSVKLRESGRKKYRVISFNVSHVDANYLRREGDLVSSSSVPEFQFLCSKVNPCFSVNRAVVSLFRSIVDELAHLRTEVVASSKAVPCIITGSALGGSVASLFTLWLLDKLDLATTKRPLCITYGAPLLGDAGLQQAISQYSTWNSCFCHVVHKDDALPKAYVSPSTQPATQAGTYVPFGTYMWFSESGCACFQSPESTMELLMMSMEPGQNVELQSYDYGATIANLKARSICKDPFTVHGEDVDFRASVSAGLAATGLVNSKGGQRDFGPALKKIASAEAEIITRQLSVFDSAKRLNEVKVYLAYMEWYKKISEASGGYYDCYKNKATKRDHDVVKFKRILNDHWERVVDEVEKKPQREGAPMRVRWLFGGTNYRRLVEPLNIAEYYQEGKDKYLTRGRPSHYRQLQQWLEMDNFRQIRDSPRRARRQSIAAVVTEDSCFWAHVEEAILACSSLKGGGSNGHEVETIKGFEEYTMALVKDYSLSPDVFLKESSFMQWWKEYHEMLEKQMMGVGYTSPLVEFMRNCYLDYTKGIYGLSE